MAVQRIEYFELEDLYTKRVELRKRVKGSQTTKPVNTFGEILYCSLLKAAGRLPREISYVENQE